jgi:hypothetical protein
VVDFLASRNKRRELPLSEITVIHYPEETRSKVFDFIYNDIRPSARKVIDAVRQGVEPSTEELARVLKTTTRNVRQVLFLLRKKFFEQVTRSLELQVQRALEADDLQPALPVFELAVNPNQRDAFRVAAFGIAAYHCATSSSSHIRDSARHFGDIQFRAHLAASHNDPLLHCYALLNDACIKCAITHHRRDGDPMEHLPKLFLAKAAFEHIECSDQRESFDVLERSLLHKVSVHDIERAKEDAQEEFHRTYVTGP